MKFLYPSAVIRRRASEKGTHSEAFQSWRWVLLAAILLAVVTIGTFYFSSAQAQEANGAITGLTLTSDTPGTLTVSWDTASPAPTDYRVDWAKSSEDYTSWTVDDGHVYPADTATTVTITGLGHDTEYKIRMRARYYKGEHKGKSWGGPWATATITVAGEPAETPTPEPEQEEESTTEAGTIDTLAATDDDTGQLVLTWGPPAAPNATPTDYHVNWAKSTEDYPADTAEAGNVHPTTTTHTLASLEYDTEYNIRVRARYTDGENADSPWTGPWTETTSQVKQPLPAAPSLIGTAATPDGHVMLSWQDPSDDPITGYQVLRGPDADSMVVIEEDTGSNSTTYTDTEPPAGQTHTYAVQARNSTGLSPQSNTVTATVPASESREEPVAAQQNSCPGNQLEPTPSDVQVDAVPIVVTSTTAEYFVLYAQHKVDTDTTMELPVLVKRGEEGTTTLSESVATLPKDQYRVEKYFVADPADVDGDCVDDITELDNLGSMNPVNPAPVLAASDGAPAIPNHEAYEEGFASSGYFTKFIISDIDKARPKLYFMNTTTHPLHDTFLERVGLKRSNVVLGHMIYSPGLVAPNGTQGVYYFWGTNARHSFVTVARVYTLVAAGMPFLNDNLALLVPNGLLHYYNANLPLFKESRMNRIFLDDLGSGPVFVGLNPGEGYGRLRQLRADERPHPRDIVVYEALPNELPPVAGIISTVPQTPLSHVNLRAVQNGIPNAYVRGFLDNDEYRSLLGTFVRFSVTESGWDVSPATAAEVAAHYAASRPTHTQTPRRDLSVRTITPLSQVEFEHWDSFGVKAANVAVLGTLGFPDGTIPDGYAIPFYFYDEFMKANNFYTEIREMMAAEEFQTDFDEQEDELKKLRKKIKKGATPQWIIDALTAMHGAYPEGQSLRYRSSTNNEDLPGFNGAGLYDSNTQHPHETVEDGIDKSLKQVYASLWNFRAFSEREFHRVDHLAAAMGVLVHPNYSDELANGVAVSFDLLSAKEGTHYVNSQLGEDLVTNPEAHSVPEEVLLHQDGSFSILATSNLVEPGLLLMSVTQMQQLRRHLGVIHTHFKGLYNPAAGKPFAMEIEFKITSENILAIKQARPWVFGGAAAVNEAPTITGDNSLSFREEATGTVASYRATDPEGGTIRWLVGGSDGNDFRISETGALTFVSPPDYESPAGVNGNEYLVTVQARDDGGKTASLDVTVTVTPVNEPPTVTGDTVLSVDENTETFSRTYFASDPEGTASTFAWSVSGTDSGDFNINRDNAELTFRNIPNYESPADSDRNNEYLVTVVATDQGNLRGNLPVTVTVNDVNEPPTITGDTSKSYPENSVRSVATYRATDPERRPITWSVSGTDDDDFAISETGALTFANIPDFEMPADADRDNEYLVTVVARDGSNTATLDVTVTVTNSTGAEEPTITTTGTPSPYRENGIGAVYTFRARDPQGRAVSWRVTGTDSHAFDISSSGALTFLSPPDFEHPTDADRDNRYEITVVVTDDQSLTDSVDVTVTVTNDAEGVEPTISTRRPPATYRENGTSAVYTFRASDPQSRPITWSLEGDDREDFTIPRDSSGRGVLAFFTPPDFEAPADSDQQNDYELTVIATDEDGDTDRLSFTITVTDVNEGPEITRIGNAPGSVPETYDPTRVLARYTATDPEDISAAITRWSTSGTDGGDFVMNEQGELRFRNQPDHERPADSNRDNVYVFTVRASDGRYYGEFSETVMVDNVNEPPTITTTSTSAATLRQPENRTTRLYTYRATDPEGETIRWSVGGVDDSFFAINEQGELSFDETQPPDYEQPGDSDRDNVYDATVRAQDSGGITAELEIAVTVTPVNEGPEVTSGQSAFTISENQDLPNAVYSGFDPEGGTVTRWSVGGRDGGDFTITQGGLLTFRNLPDYENAVDSDRDNVYELEVRPYDGRYYGSFDVMVTVSDVNEPPAITTTSSSATTMTHAENRASRLYTYRATDPEGATIAWSVAGVDRRFFAIDGQGQFYFSTTNPPDFEARAASGQDHVYNVTVQAGDGAHTAMLPVAVTVTDVNEGPEVSGASSFTIAENQGLPNAVYTATDPEGAYVTRWSVGGKDGGDFFITQGGTLYFRSPPDYERPADSNRDNTYEVLIQPSDGRNTGSHAVTVTVTDVNEPPEIRSGSSTSFTQPENRTSRLYAYSATDPEQSAVTWSVGGTDESHFTIDERGQFSFREDSPPDFDAPDDVGRNNIYNVTIQATDPESNTASLPVIVRVTEVNEGPVITRQGSATISVPENHAVTQALATYTASDPERPTVSITQWSTTGTDGGDFVMNALGELRFRNSPNYERPVDSNRDNVYEVTIRASDGRNTGTLEEVQVVTVTDVNEPPTITTTGRTAFSQPENRTSALYTFRATDPEGSAVTWTPAGPDGSHFTMDERGALYFSDPPDFDNPSDAGRNNVYNVTVQASDDQSNPANLDVVVTVTDDNESVEPTITTRRPPATYRENGTSTVYTFRASDPQRGVIAWSLQGDDGEDFNISESGALTFAITPDFENPADLDQDNVYELTVVATDDEGHTDRLDFAIAVTNHNEGVEPTISTRRPPATYRENGTGAVYTFRANDPQRDPISWSMDGTDAADFTITTDSSGRGVLTFNDPPDFENPADADRDNVYELAVTATDDGGNADRVDFAITVTDVNEGPRITLEGTAVTSVPENYADTRVLARYTARDPEKPGTGIYQWSTTGRDGGDFVISALGELRFRSSPDFERPADADRDNVYEVTVRAYDGRVYGTLEEPLMVTVTEMNEAPVITTKSRTEFTVRENSTSTVHTYRARDEDEDDIVRWSVAGTDGEDFAIYNGMLTFRRLPDLEIPADSDRDNVYEITVVAADNGGLRDTVDATIAITDQSEGPVIAGTTSYTVRENYDITQALGSYAATDARDMRAVHPQWSLSGRDGGDFVIEPSTGALAFRNTPDYDRPADSDRDNMYEVTVRAHDSRAYGYLNVVVTVTNINEAAPVVTGRTSHSVRENTISAIHTYRATDPDLGDTIAWSTGGADGHLFRMSDRGELSFRVGPDFESPQDAGQDNVYDLEVVATDGEGLRGSLAVTVTVTALNEGPVVSGTAAFTINENQDLSSAIYTARDPEAIGGVTTTITWSVSGRDGGDFTIDRETGALTFRITPNYERPADSNRDNVYEVTVRAYDGRNYGTFDVTVTVLAVNEGPEITGRDAFSYRENGAAALHTYRATDPEGDDFVWDLGGLDASDFEISRTGVLTFASPPNFDSPAGSGTDGNEYLVTVQARDDRGNTGELPVTVTVTDRNEGAVVSGLQVIAVQENRDPTLLLAAYTAIDPEGLPIARWSLSGSDGGDFTIGENGELTFRNTPDYDRPADSNRDNEYLVTVRAYDGRTYGSLDVTITVSNRNEHDPVINSGSSTSFSYREESASVLYTYRGTDQDKDDVITWTTDGTDGHLFEFNDRNGLVFKGAPDYEDPRDAGRDNEYELTVVATDSGGRSDRLDVTVTVTAVDEGPEITGTTTYTVNEGQELTGATFSARDPEDANAEVTSWRLAGSDAGDFNIDSTGMNSAQLAFRNTPDYDQPADSNRDNEYLLTIRAYNGSTYGSLDVTVTVTDQNEAEPIVTGRNTLSVRENTTSTLHTYRATDLDRGAEIRWSVRGADGGDFIISEDGELSFSSNPNHERPADSNADNVYEITVVASDGSNEGTLDVTVTITDVNEGPEISGSTSISVSENREAVLATYRGTDPEDVSAEITRWSVTGRDGGDFTINEDGELTFRYPPNFERPADANRDNEYEVTVRASDGRVYGTYDVTVTVTAVDEAPEFRSGSRTEFTYRENGTSSLYTYRAIDPEGVEVAWSVGGADASFFDTSNSGVLTFIAPPDFENPVRFDGTEFDNEYEVSVVATDQTGHSDDLTVTVTVTDVNEGPIITGASEFTVQENHDAALGTYTARDPEIPDLEITRWSVTGRDGGDFAIDETGELTFRNPPDSERPADANRDSIYEVTVRASDGRYYGNFDVTVTVEEVDEAPEFRSDSEDTFSYQENQTSTLHTYRATDPEGGDITWGLSGTDSAAFVISEEGELTFLNVPDYEQPADSDDDNVYEVTVEASDEHGNTAPWEVTVTVVNLTD